MRIDTQKQTLSARDDSIKKLLEMLQTKGEGKEEEARVHQQMQMVAQKQVKYTGSSHSLFSSPFQNNSQSWVWVFLSVYAV